MKIICIPGLGVDERIFLPQKNHFGSSLHCLRYIEPYKKEPLSAYCERWAKQIQPQLEQPYVLLGMSLGGMCAQELSQYLAPKAVILLGSLHKAMPYSGGHLLMDKIGQNLPNGMLKVLRWYFPYITAVLEGLNPEHRSLLVNMSRDINIDFYKWQAHAGMQWIQHGFLGQDSCPVFRAHGAKDKVLFLETDLQKDDLYLADAQHLINLTHAPVINHFIEKCIKKVQSTDNLA